MATWGWLTATLLFGLVVGWFGRAFVDHLKNKAGK